MTVDWESHRWHRQRVAADRGQWVGLLDAEGEPLWDAAPIIDMQAPETRFEVSSLRMTMRIRSRQGVVHPMVSELIADGLGTDGQGAMVPVTDSTRLLIVERPGSGPGTRRAYRVVSSTLSGEVLAPTLLRVDGVSMLDILAGLPCPSIPDSWTGTWITSDRDWAGPWSKPRLIQDVKFASVATGFTVSGPAEATIRALIVRSLAAAFRAAGVAGDPPVVVDPTPSGRPSPTVVIRPTDDSIWATVAAPAAAAGVRISADLWLPGDTWGPSGLTKPTVVVGVEQMGEVIL